MTRRLLAPIALAAACAAAALTVTPRPALAFSDPVLSSGDDGSGSSICGDGRTVECGSTTIYKCVEWVPQISISATGASVTYVCGKSITTVSKSYKD